jgi:sulfonate transport system permease protein
MSAKTNSPSAPRKEETEDTPAIFIGAKIRAKLPAIFLGLLIPVLTVWAWQYFGTHGYINQSIFTNPGRIITKLLSMIEKGQYFKHLIISLKRILDGYLIGAAAGFVLGTLAILFKPVGQLLSYMISFLRPIPPIACIPFLILWLGIGESAKISVIVIGAFWPVLLNTMQGIRSADENLLELGRAFGKNKRTVLLKIILPSAFPSIFTGLRLGISNAWTCVVTAEMIAASAGVGYLISYGRELSQPDVLFVGIFSIGVVGMIIDFLVIKLQSIVVYWVDPQKD